MSNELKDWLSRYASDPKAVERELRDPVLWIEPHEEEEPASNDERSLHTASGVGPVPFKGEPILLLVKKTKQNAFQRITIGRTPNNDLVIDDDSVSRFHAWFQKPGAQWELVDAGSKNGTFVSVKKLGAKKPHPLTGGEKLRIGTVDAWFLLPQRVLERLRRRVR